MPNSLFNVFNVLSWILHLSKALPEEGVVTPHDSQVVAVLISGEGFLPLSNTFDTFKFFFFLIYYSLQNSRAVICILLPYYNIIMYIHATYGM